MSGRLITLIVIPPTGGQVFEYKFPPRLLWLAAALLFTTSFYLFSIPGSYLFERAFGIRLSAMGPHADLEIGTDSERAQYLQREAERIELMVANVNNLTLAQLQTNLEAILAFMRTLHEEAVAQQRLVEGLRRTQDEEAQRVLRAQDTADSVSAIADSIVSVRAGQVEALTSVLTREAEEQAEVQFWLGVALSFPVGVIASVCAQWIVSKVRSSARPHAA